MEFATSSDAHFNLGTAPLIELANAGAKACWRQTAHWVSNDRTVPRAVRLKDKVPS